MKFELEENTWHNASSHLAAVTLAVLEQYKAAHRNGTPLTVIARMFPSGDPISYTQRQWLLADARWEGILKRMIRAFRLLVADADGKALSPLEIEQVNDGLRMYSLYFRDLWD